LTTTKQTNNKTLNNVTPQLMYLPTDSTKQYGPGMQYVTTSNK